jgi:arginyl-tRNA synthetase
VYLELQKRLGEAIRAALKDKYDLQIENVPLETPPDLRFGEIATPIALQLARSLRKSPKIIAQEIVAALGAVDGFASFEVAGAGYINARLDRATAVQMVATSAESGSPSARGHVLVEHTSINPNKAAHIGHLRNAILGDTFVRLLRASSYKVDVQNYIDNTGVQVADVVVALVKKHKRGEARIRELVEAFDQYKKGIRLSNRAQTASQLRSWNLAKKYDGRFDYYCWDEYARVAAWYQFPGKSEERKQIKLRALHEIERGKGVSSRIAELISTAVLRRHLETMLRLDIEYDFLPRESEILHLKFWDAAFDKLKQSGVLYFENEGKNKGCWVMRRPAMLEKEIKISQQAGRKNPYEYKNPEERFEEEDSLLRESADFEETTDGPDENAKVIVRSNGTVTYVGKDIAYHLWKFGLLGRDFGYTRFFTYPDRECWISTEHGETVHPHFGNATAIYNVIDSRQVDPQANVIQALRGMGYTEEADHYTHFSYEMVALTPNYATDLGYILTPEDFARPYIEISGRKGFGVKADDLMDLMILAANSEILRRHPEWEKGYRNKAARQIAYGALRYFMVKYTRNSVIAFDQESALSPEGETGPYIQYAVVRIRNIFRKGNTTPETVLAEFAELAGKAELGAHLAGEENEDIWELWLRAGRRTQVLEQCISASEPAYLAKHAFQLAQDFANFYHRHHILTEENPARKTFLLATAAVALRELVASLALLGIESPEAM